MSFSPAAGVRLFLLDDEAVVFHAARQTLHALNTSAAVIWCLLEDGLDVAAVVADLQDRFGLTHGEAAAYVATALEDWHAKGLCGGPTRDTVALRQYAFRGRVIAFRFTALEQLRVIDPVLSHLAASAPRADSVVDIVAHAGGIDLLCDGAPRAGCATLAELAPLAKSLVWQIGLSVADYLLNIHAGVVAGPDGCVLLPGAPGSGKSTLTAALVAAGCWYFSDEVALLAEDTLEVMPFPLALCVKDTGRDVAATVMPDVAHLPFHARGDGKRVAYVRPPAGRIPRWDARRPVAAIVFPRFEAGVATTLCPVRPAEALARVLSQCLGVGPTLTDDHVARLIAWIGRVSCHTLTFSHLPEAVAVVSALPGLGTRSPAELVAECLAR